MREVVSNEWFTVLIVLCLCVLALAKFLYGKRFNDFVSVIGNSKYLKIYAKEQKFVDQFDALLFINLIISFSLFCFLSYSTLVAELEFDLILFSKILLGIGSILLIKVLFERLIGSVFGIDTLIDDYIFQKTNYRNYLGLLLLPINILLIYTLEPNKNLIFISIGLLIVIHISGFITSFKTHQKLILNNLFYFILYLCALEIGPYIILYKVFS